MACETKIPPYLFSCLLFSEQPLTIDVQPYLIPSHASHCKILFNVFPVPSRDVINQTLPVRE
jgi:hypothetical protein